MFIKLGQVLSTRSIYCLKRIVRNWRNCRTKLLRCPRTLLLKSFENTWAGLHLAAIAYERKEKATRSRRM